SSHPAAFTSTKGINVPVPNLPNPVQEGNLIFSDPPRHRELRNLINTGFTRRQVTLFEPRIWKVVRGVLDELEPDSVQDFIAKVAAPLPIRTISGLLGVPPEDRERFRAWTDVAIGTAKTRTELDPMEAVGQLYHYLRALVAGRTEDGDDLLSI